MDPDPQAAGGGQGAPRALNRTLLIFENPDKLGDRPSGIDEAMPRWPFRCVFSGPPGCGKRNLILNLVYRLHPPPSAIHIVHIDPDTTEYSCLEELGVPIYIYSPEDFPTIENIQDPDPAPIGDSEVDPVSLEAGEGGAAKGPMVDPEAVDESVDLGSDPLVIVDEVTSDVLPPAMKSRFERLMNFGSSHKNTSVVCSIQSVVNLPPKVRRGFNNFCLWQQPDTAATTMAATRAGVPPAMLNEMFEGLCVDRLHDSIWVDCTQPPDSPWRFRLNFLTPIRAAETVRLGEDY